MLASEIITKYENFTGDSLDADFTLQLVNDVMHEIEEEVKPEGLKKMDTSASTVSGQTYTTGISLPSDFFIPVTVIYVGTTPYTQVPFEHSVLFRDTPNRFYIDHANAQYRLTGRQNSIQSISFPYYYATPDIDANSSPVWPERFHSLIPLKMAMMYFAIDGGEKPRSWDDRYEAFYERRLNRFKDYDAALKLAAINHSTPYGELTDNEVPLSMM
jgi:hypothetical protein